MSPQSNTDQGPKEQKRCREAEIATDSDGEPLGACIYLPSTDLDSLGIDSSKTDHLHYVVEDGNLQIMESGEQ